jgi:hypothetical protein
MDTRQPRWFKNAPSPSGFFVKSAAQSVSLQTGPSAAAAFILFKLGHFLLQTPRHGFVALVWKEGGQLGRALTKRNSGGNQYRTKQENQST